MAYQNTTWTKGDTITAVKLNHLEQGVYDIADNLDDLNLEIYSGSGDNNLALRVGESILSTISLNVLDENPQNPTIQAGYYGLELGYDASGNATWAEIARGMVEDSEALSILQNALS